MTLPNDNFTFLDKGVLSALMKKMDKDVATRLAISAVSLNPRKINDAVKLAFQEMAIRAREKKNQKAKENLETKLKANSKEQAQELVNAIEAILKNAPLVPSEGDFEIELFIPEDEEDDDEGKNS